MSEDKPKVDPKTEDQLDEARREVLRKLGVYGAYTAPAMLAILHSTRAVAATGPGIPGGGGPGGGGSTVIP